MEDYDLDTAKFLLKNGRIKIDEYNIIKKFIKNRDNYFNACEIMKKHFREKHVDEINNAKNIDDLKQIKEQLRVMPESVGKTLIFREIIMKEDTL
jgi:hypothetical protein